MIRKLKNKLRQIFLSTFYRRVRENDYDIVQKSLINQDFQKHLDLGSGPNPRNPFKSKQVFGVDIRSYDVNPMVLKCDISVERLPFSDECLDSITAFDVIEHIPRVVYIDRSPFFPFIHLMNEAWRTLKYGGYFLHFTPSYPSKEAFQDPTHTNLITEDTFRLYFCGDCWAKIYGFYGQFEIVDEGWMGSHYWCLLRKSKCDIFFDINALQK